MLAYIVAKGYQGPRLFARSSLLADWYVYQHDGDPLGPWSTDTVADAVLAGRLAPDVWVAAPGGPRWLRALDVPVIARLVDGIPTKPRRDSGLRMMPQAYRDQPSTGSIERAGDATQASASAPGAMSSMSASSAPATVRTPDETAPMHAPLRALQTLEDVLAFAADDDEEPRTDPITPPSSDPSTPQPPPPQPDRGVQNDRALDAPMAERRRRRKNG